MGGAETPPSCWRTAPFKCCPRRRRGVGRFARGSTPWLAMPLLAAGVAAFCWANFGGLWLLALAVLALLVELFFLVFFRDPERAAAAGVASPAPRPGRRLRPRGRAGPARAAVLPRLLPRPRARRARRRRQPGRRPRRAHRPGGRRGPRPLR